jgi:excisionase family DNA binding protein
MNSEVKPALYSTNDARRIGCFGNTKLYELIGEGRLEAVKLGGKTLITAASLDAFIASLPRADIFMKAGRSTKPQQAAV